MPSSSLAERSAIGRSLEGRPIVAVERGPEDAPLEMLVFGCIHGNETAGMRIARSLLASGPPGGTRLTIVPSLNPDGVAARTRGNARGVDLNRNFEYRWRPLGGLEFSGRRALSEPESRAARRLILRTRPDVTLWFHQPLDLVDRSGGDPVVERRFAELIGLPYALLPRPPGSASSWQNERFPGDTSFVVELPPIVSAKLVRRAARAVRTLARELASPDVGDARRS